MVQVPPLATPMVVIGAISRYLALSTAFTMKTLYFSELGLIMPQTCDNQSNLVSSEIKRTYSYQKPQDHTYSRSNQKQATRSFGKY